MTQSRITERQMKFIREYQQVPNASKAAVKSGYSSRSSRQIAHKLLSKPQIKEYLATLRESTAELSNLTALNLVSELQSLKEEAMFGEVPNDRTAMNCIHLQAKLLGCYEPDYHERQQRIEKAKSQSKYDLSALSREERGQLLEILSKCKREDQDG